MLEISSFERHLSQEGKFCLLDWLLSRNLLAYGDYEAWRLGSLKILDKQIDLEEVALAELMERTEKQAKALGLSSQPQDYYSWQEHSSAILCASSNKDIHQQLTQQWLRPQDLPQLDLFMDNSAVIAENRLLSALGGRQWQQAKQHLTQLTELNPSHQRLGRYQDLLNYGEHMQVNEIIDSDAISAELQGLEQEVCPLAKEALGASARDYLACAWRRIADNLQGMTFNAQQPHLHQSYALGQIPDWTALEQSLSEEPLLYQHPQLMEHLGTTYSMLKQGVKSLLLWCQMIAHHNDYAETVIEQHTEQAIYPLWQQFWELDDDWPTAFFPAFVLFKQPGLIHHLSEFPVLENPATQAMAKLLHCRQRGEDEIAAREQLQKVSPALLRLFLDH